MLTVFALNDGDLRSPKYNFLKKRKKYKISIWSTGKSGVPLTGVITLLSKSHWSVSVGNNWKTNDLIQSSHFPHRKAEKWFYFIKATEEVKDRTGIKSMILDHWLMLFLSIRHEHDTGLDSDIVLYDLYHKSLGGRDSGIYCTLSSALSSQYIACCSIHFFLG